MNRFLTGPLTLLLTLTFAVISNAQWTVVSNGPSMSCFTSIGSTLFAGDMGQGVLRSTDNGDTWTLVDSGFTGANVMALTVFRNIIFAGTWGDGAFRSLDNGDHWTAINNGLLNKNVLGFAVLGDTLFAGTLGGGVFLSTDSGGNWTAMNDGLTDKDVTTLIALGPMLFAGTYDNGVFRSTPGSAWEKVNNGISSTNKMHAYVFATMGSILFVGYDEGGGVYRSTNNGANWTEVSGSFPGSDIMGLATDGTRLFAGTNGRGIFFTKDSGNQWINIDDRTYPQPPVLSLGIADTTLFCGIYNGGMMKLSITNNLARENAGSRPLNSGYPLQNHPNPCNPGTTFYYDTRGSQKGVLSIYSPSGARIFSQEVSRKGRLVWKGSNQSNGVYFCTLKVNHKTYTKKFALIQ